ncbi:iron-siderophore ABC transporter substrate-binding protein [Streptomyces sp. C11-1]|uniref:Iron-siderophore ABC transporter substrate-binding protein n=1 Tax=Streptomyces durocortorensis TaxID=2811104 RepID=A0ABY9W491_9ACTN|nr:iron-siderophore ABC transporter substrate-binding protein [Streptomyces durocortorensis]WNF30843.1 iron-siderophore ABC transporter substrate-binding protein [Streptomyces durocortorensis]
MKNQYMTWPVLAATASLTLTACGTTEAPKQESAKDTAVTVTDSRGKKVTLDGPAKRVVGTEWNVVETLVTLGVQPVGVADVKGYTAYDKAAPLKGDVKDIGTRGEPSVATVAGLKPDLIVATTDLSDSAVAQLSKAAPVVVVRSADASRQIDQMIDNVNLIAEATGTEEKAKSEIDSFRKAVADGKKKLAAAGLDGKEVAFADGWQEGNQVSVRPYVKGSLLSDLNTELGLADPWKLKGDKAYGLAATDVEGLTKIGDARFTYIANDADNGDPFADGLKDNAVWKSLPFVKNDEVHRLPDGIWMFGGTASMREYVDALVGALTA